MEEERWTQAGKSSAGRRRRKKDAGSGPLTDEISMLRALIRQARSLVKEGMETPELLSILQAVSRASANLAALLKTEKTLDSGESASDLIEAALDELEAEMRALGEDNLLTRNE